MSLNNFIPTIWANAMLTPLRKTMVGIAVCNTDYQGDATFGNTVKINEIGPVAMTAYTKGATVTFSELQDAQKSLLIDQMYYFGFYVDDVDQVQQKPKVMAEAMAEAAYSAADNADQYIFGLYADAGVVSGLGSTGSVTNVSSGNVITTLTLAAQRMDENNIPRTGRWLVAPPWLITKLVLANVLGTNYIPARTDTNAIFDNGLVTRAFGFDIYMSNNVYHSSTTYYKVLAGTRRAISYVDQINKVEAVRPFNKFQDAVKGLHVYGAKVVRPAELACLTIAEGTG